MADPNSFVYNTYTEHAGAFADDRTTFSGVGINRTSLSFPLEQRYKGSTGPESKLPATVDFLDNTYAHGFDARQVMYQTAQTGLMSRYLQGFDNTKYHA